MAKFKLNALSILSVLLIVAGVVFYLSWGWYFNGWNMFDKDYIGVYAITIVFLMFGILGLLLIRAKSNEAAGKK